MEKLILKLLEDNTVMSAISLLITSVCGVGVAYLTYKRNQLVELSKGAKRSSLRSEYLQIYNSKDFTLEDKWGMTRPLVNEYFNKLQGNHYIHGLDAKLKEKLEKDKENNEEK